MVVWCEALTILLENAHGLGRWAPDLTGAAKPRSRETANVVWRTVAHLAHCGALWRCVALCGAVWRCGAHCGAHCFGALLWRTVAHCMISQLRGFSRLLATSRGFSRLLAASLASAEPRCPNHENAVALGMLEPDSTLANQTQRP